MATDQLAANESAISFLLHAGQRRADGTPFILHPLEVATRLHFAGAPDQPGIRRG
jgi:(p)ppGpp synthase/HD superfamily hydrolase